MVNFSFPGWLGVSRETLGDLVSFSKELEKWSRAINLVAPNSLDDVWMRHVLDSAQIVQMVPFGNKWCDLGSGGGLPGLVIAIILRELFPESKVVLLESDARKSSFLKVVAAKHQLNVEVIRTRIESSPMVGADVLTARGLAPLQPLLGMVYRHLDDGGVALLQKGRNFEAEIEQARNSWDFDVEILGSLVDDESRILRLNNLKPKVAQA